MHRIERPFLFLVVQPFDEEARDSGDRVAEQLTQAENITDVRSAAVASSRAAVAASAAATAFAMTKAATARATAKAARVAKAAASGQKLDDWLYENKDDDVHTESEDGSSISATNSVDGDVAPGNPLVDRHLGISSSSNGTVTTINFYGEACPQAASSNGSSGSTAAEALPDALQHSADGEQQTEADQVAAADAVSAADDAEQANREQPSVAAVFTKARQGANAAASDRAMEAATAATNGGTTGGRAASNEEAVLFVDRVGSSTAGTSASELPPSGPTNDDMSVGEAATTNEEAAAQMAAAATLIASRPQEPAAALPKPLPPLDHNDGAAAAVEEEPAPSSPHANTSAGSAAAVATSSTKTGAAAAAGTATQPYPSSDEEGPGAEALNGTTQQQQQQQHGPDLSTREGSSSQPWWSPLLAAWARKREQGTEVRHPGTSRPPAESDVSTSQEAAAQPPAASPDAGIAPATDKPRRQSRAPGKPSGTGTDGSPSADAASGAAADSPPSAADASPGKSRPWWQFWGGGGGQRRQNSDAAGAVRPPSGSATPTADPSKPVDNVYVPEDLPLEEIAKELARMNEENLRTKEHHMMGLWMRAVEKNDRAWVVLLCFLLSVSIGLLSVVAYRLSPDHPPPTDWTPQRDAVLMWFSLLLASQGQQ